MSAPVDPSGLDVTNVGRWGVFEARLSGVEPARAAILSAPVEPSRLERPFRAPQRSRAGPEVANVGRRVIFEARPSQLSELGPGASGACKGSYGNFELDIPTSIYIYVYISTLKVR